MSEDALVKGSETMTPRMLEMLKEELRNIALNTHPKGRTVF